MPKVEPSAPAHLEDIFTEETFLAWLGAIERWAKAVLAGPKGDVRRHFAFVVQDAAGRAVVETALNRRRGLAWDDGNVRVLALQAQHNQRRAEELTAAAARSGGAARAAKAGALTRRAISEKKIASAWRDSIARPHRRLIDVSKKTGFTQKHVANVLERLGLRKKRA